MLKQRLLTAVVMIAVMVGAVTQFDSAQLAVLLAVIMALGAWEWSRLVGFHANALRVAYVAAVLCCAYAIWLRLPVDALGAGLPGDARWWWTVLGWWVLAGLWLRFTRLAPGSHLRIAEAFAVLPTLLPTWVAMLALQARGMAGGWLMFLLASIWIADSAAYFAGKRWGRARLSPLISPGKTWAGAWGALCAVALLAPLGGLLLKVDIASLAAFTGLCVVTTVFSIIGDLFESMLKRQSNIKDSGTLIPGHGGVLDRIDSLTAAAPVFLLGLEWLRL